MTEEVIDPREVASGAAPKQGLYELPVHGIKITFELTPEHKELLMQLNRSHGWNLYRRLLMNIQVGYQQSMYPMKDQVEITKTLGSVVGLNLAIAQLGILVEQFEKEAKRVAEESKNQPKPNR